MLDMWHAMCAAAGWYVELTQRGFLQELGRDCGHMAARNASKQLMCVQCGLYKSRDDYKTPDSRLFRLTQTRISRCLAKVAAARAAPLVLSRPPQLRRVPAPALSHSSTSPRLYVHPLLVGRE